MFVLAEGREKKDSRTAKLLVGCKLGRGGASALAGV